MALALTDLHAHVLPGIDDGPRDLVEAIAMAERAAEGGTRVLAATPHVREDYPAVVPAELAERVASINAEIAAHGIDLRVVLGGEVGLTAALELDDDELRTVSLGGAGHTLLLETPHAELPSIFEELLGRLGERGYRILLAHPELSATFQHDPDRLGRLVERGVLLQVTARALVAGSRSRSGTLARTVLRNGWVHVLASDGHRSDWRPPDLGPLVEQAAAAFPEHAERLRWLASVAPAAVLAGEDLPVPPAVAARRRGLLRRR